MIKLIDVYATHRPEIERFLYVLLAERLEEPETNISHTTMPTIEEHQAFIASRAYRAWYVIATPAGELIGAVNLTRQNEVGIVVQRAHRGRGYAKAALRWIMATHPPLPPIPSKRSHTYIANVRHDNRASIALFESLGARILQHTYTLEREHDQH